MFFSLENFTSLPNKQDREVAANTANDVVKDRGTVFYGRFLKDGTGVDFTTERKATDSHVLIGIGIRQMAEFAPTKTYIQTSSVDEERILESQKMYIAQLERENKNLRGGPNGTV